MPKTKLIMTMGLPASGKSTWSKEQALNSEGRIKRINKDDMRDMIDGGKHSKSNEKNILTVRDMLVSHHLHNGHDVIVDDTNLDPKHEVALRALADDFNAEFAIQSFLDVPLLDCIKRDLARPRSVGERVIMSMFNRYLKPEMVPQPEDGPEPYTVVPGLPWCIISDIDGTLAHGIGVHRGPHDLHKVGADTIDPATSDILNTYSWASPLSGAGTETTIFLMSGRNEKSRADTESWLAKHGVPYRALYMRPEDDIDPVTKQHKKDTVIKAELFDKYIRGKYNVMFILDDRQAVVDQWRAMGLKCLQVQPGDF